MLPLLKDETVIYRKWITEDELLNYFSIGQCTPGIIAINVSTFCGYKLKGITGAIVATSAMVLPSLIIIMLVASVLNRYIDMPAIASAFAGIRIGVTALLANLIWDMGLKLYRESSFKILHGSIFAISLILLIFGNVSAVLIVIIAAISGFLPKFYKGNKQ